MTSPTKETSGPKGNSMIYHCSTALNIDTGVEMTMLPNARTLVGVILNNTTLKSVLALLLNCHFKLCSGIQEQPWL